MGHGRLTSTKSIVTSRYNLVHQMKPQSKVQESGCRPWVEAKLRHSTKEVFPPFYQTHPIQLLNSRDLEILGLRQKTAVSWTKCFQLIHKAGHGNHLYLVPIKRSRIRIWVKVLVNRVKLKRWKVKNFLISMFTER